MNQNEQDYDNDLGDDEESTADQQQNRGDRKWVRDLERRAKHGDRAMAERDALARELAMLKSGIDLGSPQGKLFMKAYDGEATVEAITAAAREYGVIGEQAPAGLAEEMAAHDRVARAAAGAVSVPAEDPLELIRNAETAEEVLRLVERYGGSVDYDSPGGFRSIV